MTAAHQVSVVCTFLHDRVLDDQFTTADTDSRL
jgi:hypothetical protein